MTAVLMWVLEEELGGKYNGTLKMKEGNDLTVKEVDKPPPAVPKK